LQADAARLASVGCRLTWSRRICPLGEPAGEPRGNATRAWQPSNIFGPENYGNRPCLSPVSRDKGFGGESA
jgi:hypothetical protein